MSRVVVATAVAAMAAATATGASAATVSKSGGHIHYAAAAGEDNSLDVTTDAVNNYFEDPAGLDAGSGCTDHPTEANVVICPKGGTTLMIFDFGDLDDDVTVTGVDFIGLLERGGSGNDTLRGSHGSATSTLIGGEGTDSYEAPGPAFDAVSYSDKTAPLAASLDDVANDPDGENVPSSADALVGGSAGDTLTGSDGAEYLFGGPGADALSALAGTDILVGDAGADDMSGGAGTDIADYSWSNAPVTVTLDDTANDGASGEGDNARADVERIRGGFGGDDLSGDARSNTIAGRPGNDELTGGAGEDALFGESGDDTLNARDGVADSLSCGSGVDVANADELDSVSADCENVTRADRPPATQAQPTSEDRPPAVSFSSPGDNARVRPEAGTSVVVDASDDRGVARVELVDDGRVVGSDSSAPYEFAYRPGIADVGANTLVATAVDTAGQRSDASRRLRVGRYDVGLRARLSALRGIPPRLRVTGALRLPAGVSRAEACRRGSVVARLSRAGSTLARRRARLTRRCRFTVRVRAPATTSAKRGRLRLTLRFRGNRVLKPHAVRGIAVRRGRI